MEALLKPTTLHQKLWYIDLITMSVCLNCNIDPVDLKGHCKKREFVDGRRIVAYLSVKHLDIQLWQIAKKIGCKDHSTVIHQNTTCQDLMKFNKPFNALVKDIEMELHLN